MQKNRSNFVSWPAFSTFAPRSVTSGRQIYYGMFYENHCTSGLYVRYDWKARHVR